MENIKEKNKGGLTAIEEDAEASNKSDNSPTLKTPAKKEEAQADIVSKGSGKQNLSNLNLLSPGVGGGGAVDQQFKDDINKRLEE